MIPGESVSLLKSIHNSILMKLLISIFFLGFSTIAYSQTQAEMTELAKADYEKVDKELNIVYKAILKEYSKNELFIEKLKTAQRYWIAYRDAELAMKYPEEDKLLNYGSAYQMCGWNYLANMTMERTLRLKLWLNDSNEGEICSGSIGVKE
jgi:uncharacterized protein YecT (DUF1311 family)